MRLIQNWTRDFSTIESKAIWSCIFILLFLPKDTTNSEWLYQQYKHSNGTLKRRWPHCELRTSLRVLVFEWDVMLWMGIVLRLDGVRIYMEFPARHKNPWEVWQLSHCLCQKCDIPRIESNSVVIPIKMKMIEKGPIVSSFFTFTKNVQFNSCVWAS